MDNVNPYDKAHELARAIKNSDVYQHYLAAKRELDKNPETKNQIKSLRQAHMELSRAQLMGQELPEDRIRELTSQFADLSRQKEVNEFLKAESAFIQIFNDLMEIIQKALDMD